MKNLHLIPTDNKSSRLYFNINDKEFQICEINEPYIILKPNRHLYITSDEEIKEGDWVLNIEENTILKPSNDEIYDIENSEAKYYEFIKKIILTTDQDLIKGGVQAIDDNFMEWFVKNPSCEVVEVIYEPKNYLDTKQGWGYELIIPKEEYEYIGECKGNNGNGCFMDSSGHDCGCFIKIPKEEPKQEQEVCNHCGKTLREQMKGCGEITCYRQFLSKQETLEEAFHRIFDSLDYYEFDFTSFRLGAKWQQERSYSEGDLREAYFSAIKSTGDGWNGEYANGNNPNIEEKFTEGFEEWFEQFKNK